MNTKLNYRLFISILITCFFLSFSYFFFQSSFARFFESCKDFGLSIAYYFCEIFGIPNNINVTVILSSNVGLTQYFKVPISWELFKERFGEYWKLWISRNNFINYLVFLGNLFYAIAKVLVIAIPIIILFYFLFKRNLRKQNNDYNVDSMHLKRYKKFEVKILYPFISFIKDLFAYFKAKKFIRLWLIYFAFYFNLITIIIEFVSYYIYFVISFDLSTLYYQFYKLLLDLSTPMFFIPLWLWIILGYVIFCKIRKKIAYKRLNHMEMRNRGLINSLSVAVLIVGTMGSKKTTTKTDMELSTDIMFRDKAYELLIENDYKFPFFPWINFENSLKKAINNHSVYNLATCKRFARSKWKKFLKKKCNQNIFGYDYKRYGIYFDDKLKVVDLGQVLENYAQLYFIYIISSSLIIGNLAVRTDNVINDIGNFPVWDNDIFKKNSKEIDSISRFSKILDFDSIRLGKKVIENNKYSNSFEFGVLSITEIGKERKNMLELKELKKKDDVTNQRNDGFNDYLKMIRHGATVDNFPFVKLFGDEQRPESWGSDARDLCVILHCLGSDEPELTLPFFGLADKICSFFINRFDNLYSEYRFNRGDNTLFLYLYKKLVSKIKNFQTGIHNTFGYSCMNLGIESGTLDGQVESCKYYLMNKKIYSKRFSTDAMGDFFYKKSLKSEVGFIDLPEYKSVKASSEEFKLQHSYLMEEWFKHDEFEKKDKE